MVKKIIIISIMIGVLLPNFYFIEASAEMEKRLVSLTAQEQSQATPPETLEETKIIGEKALDIGEKELPGIIEKIWKEEVLPIWQKMWDWVKANIWSRIESWIKPEIEKRKQFFEEGFGREKEEMKEELKTEVPKVSKSLWEKFRELIK